MVDCLPLIALLDFEAMYNQAEMHLPGSSLNLTLGFAVNLGRCNAAYP